MRIILISNKLDKQIKIKTKNFESIKINVVIEKIFEKKTNSNSNSNDEIFVKFVKLDVNENQRLTLIKKIHDQSIVEHSKKKRTLKILQRFF